MTTRHVITDERHLRVYPRTMWGAYHALSLIRGHPATEPNGDVVLEPTIAAEYDAIAEKNRTPRGEGSLSAQQLADQAFPSLTRRSLMAAWIYHDIRHRCRQLETKDQP